MHPSKADWIQFCHIFNMKLPNLKFQSTSSETSNDFPVCVCVCVVGWEDVRGEGGHFCEKIQFSSVQSFSRVWLFTTPWTSACQASLSITNSRSLLELMSIASVCHPTISPSVIPFSSCFQSFPASGSFPMSQFFTSGGRSIGLSASVLPMNIQDWFPLGMTGWISLQSMGFSRQE